MYDLIIKNGNVIDGTGKDGYIADVAIKDGKIALIAQNIEGDCEIIDASGLTVTPGFIDSHSHADSAIIPFPDQREKIEQGITTSIGGQCGSTQAPAGKDIKDSFGDKFEIYRTMGNFLDYTSKNAPQGANIATFVGHNALRRATMAMENRKPTAEELEQMKELLRDGMAHGAMGVSFGLIYTPSCYAETDELIELAKVSAECNGLVSAHIRDENDYVIEAVAEFIKIIRESGARGVISHHKSAGKANWGKVKTTLKMIEEANASGLDIFCDVYPYPASHTSIQSKFIPKEYHTKGAKGIVEYLSDPEMRKLFREMNIKQCGDDDFGWIQITSCAAYPQYEGLRLPEIAKLHGKDVYETVFDMVQDSNCVCNACYFTMCEEDIETVMAFPRAMICTDSGIAGNNKVFHPRLRATFPRVLAKYVRDRKVVSLPEMIRKMTSLPAYVYGLESKGKLAAGYDADICIFDADKIQDHAEFTDCWGKTDGLEYVIVNGEVVAVDAKHNGKRPGKVLLRNVK